VVDLDHALPNEAQRWNELIAEQEKRTGEDLSAHKLPTSMKDLHGAAVVIPPEACAAVLMGTFEVLGQMWDVQARPAPEAVSAAGKAWSEALVYLKIDPKYIVIGAAIGGTAFCAMPMWQERQLIKAGELEPASKRNKQGIDPDVN